MRSPSLTDPPMAPVLTDEEAVTLRRVAFGESLVRSLRAADLLRLVALGLVVQSTDSLKLTVSGRKHVDGLPRPLFARARRNTDF